MSQPVYFTVTADYQAFIEDASTDSDYDPQSVPVGGTVTFTPLVNSGDVVRALDAEPRPVGYIPAPVTAVIDPADGRLKLRTTADSGGTGTFAPVRLLASSPALELYGPLFYRATFTNVTYANGRRGSITAFTFAAPETDTEVNLISVGRAAGSPAVNVIRATVDVGTTTTGDPDEEAAVANSGTNTNAILNFTIPKGKAASVAVGTVNTGPAYSSASVTNSGTSDAAVLNFTIPQGIPGATNTAPDTHAAASKTTPVDADELPLVDSAASWGLKKLTWANLKTVFATYYNSLTATVTNKTLSGASNTFTNIPASATPNAARLVVTTLGGGTTAENGANTWAKIATFAHSSAGTSASLILAVTTSNYTPHATALISVLSRANTDPLVDVRFLAKNGDNIIPDDGFKIISGAGGANPELWMKKGAQYGKFSVYELARTVDGTAVTITYNDNASWQSTVPTGALNNVSTAGVVAGTAPVVTSVTAPATATSTGKAGQISYDNSYVYVCTATNTWRRAALSSW